ncbi:glucose-6-phosphate dehydrogenase [Clostridium tetani]|uniref:Glucose-6-phosphate 1-dehydrogenase n=1 Tax=Clostridium tetani (strain Massachusetts / E88) TaxID=212717 RepID=Q893G0_CLOTE|nr:glucose-6-phosphate dehydrogenase [Clostridium tetani]AAO36382.1 glucose-6-phosphate 1-dehydrogenase [Clostridium tetani E88]RXI52235.1 glucose-6-phosphate dehydrogenase [Clostridium tetani]RXI54005.1 glucose-6-phosphate dehydrogenase [Clostridium tetani]RXI61812.1 glucose-6-phosphate dehydrogenase [Clostridium tetani]RXI63857.1 glucose-6-phosphate dehydrogenase [Clostridium tetani]
MKNKAITIFGGTGDLAYRKLFPSLYNLYMLGSINDEYSIIGIGRRDYTKEDYLTYIQAGVKKFARINYSDDKFDKFSKIITYYKMDIQKEEEYKGLIKYYKDKDIIKNHIYYYAVAPRFFIPITKGLKNNKCYLKDAKVIIEKPFGEDLESATYLNEQLSFVFKDKNIYHIDHYLGKEMIQNIINIRFANAIFKGIWNKDFIENIQINAFESIGVNNRGGYYDQSGALKDMVQNHLFQLLSIVAMEEPKEFNSDFIHEAQLKVLTEMKPIEDRDIDNYLVMGQYEGYREEKDVNLKSKTETYVAMKIIIDNERWQGVPFYIRTGKKLNKRETEIIIKFKSTNKNIEGNLLIIKIQPDEGIYLKFNIKKPGTVDEIQKVSMDFCQSCILENRINTPEAYERLLKACMDSDRSLFSKWEQIVVSWKYINKVLESYRSYSNKLYRYKPETIGPKEAEELVKKDNHYWINDESNSCLKQGEDS